MGDLIRRKAVIDELRNMYLAADKWWRYANETEIEARAQSCMSTLIEIKLRIEKMPSAEPKTSRIEQELHGKTPEEQYDFIYWLLMKSALNYSNSRLAIIEWLRGEKEDG